MFTHKYRLGVDRQDEDALRRLRAQGHAVVLIHRAVVGDPVNRGSVEAAMLKAGLAATKKMEVIDGVVH